MLPDTHRLGRVATGHVLLHHDAALPWFIVVPETDVEDLLDLPRDERTALMDTCAALSLYVKDVLGFPKINVASIGNVVPRLHVHVVGRRPGDLCWPHPVWGRLNSGEVWPDARLETITGDLTERLGLDAG